MHGQEYVRICYINAKVIVCVCVCKCVLRARKLVDDKNFSMPCLRHGEPPITASLLAKDKMFDKTGLGTLVTLKGVWRLTRDFYLNPRSDEFSLMPWCQTSLNHKCR